MYLIKQKEDTSVLVYEDITDLQKEIDYDLFFSGSSNNTNIEFGFSTTYSNNKISVFINNVTKDNVTNEIITSDNRVIGELVWEDNTLKYISENHTITLCPILQGNSETANNLLSDAQINLISKLEEENTTHFHKISINEDDQEHFQHLNNLDIYDEIGGDHSYSFQNRLNGTFIRSNNLTDILNSYENYKNELMNHFGVLTYNTIDNIYNLLPIEILLLSSQNNNPPQPETSGLNTI